MPSLFGWSIHGRRRLCKGFFESFGRGLGCCHPFGLCTRLLAAGLDEIRGPAPDHANELEARGPARALLASVRPICHHLDLALAA
jgi:hypothetical protein